MTAVPRPAPTREPVRRLYRCPDRGIAGGVAFGIAQHTGVSARVVRFAFVALCVAGGLGVALYGAYLIVLPADPSTPPGGRRRPRWLEYAVALVVLAGCVAVAATAVPRSGFFVAALLACLGGALIWRQASEPERTRLWTLSRTSLLAGGRNRLGRVRLAAGAALIVGGAVLVLARADVRAIRDGALAVLVTIVGLALLTGPWWMRMVSQLSEERAERVRTQERADIAARLHDSVLQTLALIQRNADSPREVTRLARGQERELRSMLYDSPEAPGQFADALRATAADVEDAYAIAVEFVVVGDAAADDRLNALVAAAREALVNAAKHAGVGSVSLYAEVEPDEISVFVKDRGAGYDPDAVADDRQGVRGSIVGRVERHGGTVRVSTKPGAGTEVELHLPTTNAPETRG